jgi:hypothetical protein
VPSWRLSVAVENIEPWVRAEIVNTFSIGETLVTGRARVRFEIANAPIKELRLKVPSEFRNVEITGSNIRSRSQSGDVRVVELQNRVRGTYEMAVTWEQAPGRTNQVELVGIGADGVERETGFIAVIARSPLQVSEAVVNDLQRLDVGDFPDWAGRPDEATALAYRYVRQGYRLVVGTQRFNEAEVLQALVEDARLTTVVADDGKTLTGLSLLVRNNGRQFLEIELPAGARIWSAFVAGQPVRPSLRNGRLLLPIQQSGDAGPLALDLTYVGTNSFPRKRGDVSFVSPKFDVPLKNARWELFLPPDFSYEDAPGTMSRETVAAASTTPPATSASFSILEYSQMERASRESSQEELRKEVVEIKRKLASGNVREATATFNRAKGNYGYFAEAGGEVDKLEKDLQTAQGSNLINAQNDFTLRNNAESSGAVNGVQVPEQAVRYDAESAKQQWAKLQQAQEMAAAKVQPLHVNLPIRGVRRAFTQVLQTEANRPMTIQLFAENTKTVSWPKRAGLGSITFLGLWGAVTMLSRLSRRVKLT